MTAKPSTYPRAANNAQTIYLTNDNQNAVSDDEVWVLFVGSPANITDLKGNALSGFRNLEIPLGSVNKAEPAGAVSVASALFASPSFAMPATPFPLQFTSGANAGKQVQVSTYEPKTGKFTVISDPTMAKPDWPLAAQTPGDQFVIGAYSQKLGSLDKCTTLPSTLSGNTDTLYGVGATALASGVLYVSYGQITYLGAAPGIASASVPYQTVELTAGTNGGATTSDLTAIDYFAIPLQIQSLNLADGSIADTRTFYFSAPTIAAQLQSIGARKNAGGLYLGPGQIAAANQGNPAPYPSFENYLDYLASNSAAPFAVRGNSNFGTPNPTAVYGINVGGNYTSTYGYSCQVKGTDGGYAIVMTPVARENSFSNAPAYFPTVPNVKNITVSLPTATASAPVGYDEIIYGAVLDANSFSITLAHDAPALTPTPLSGPFSVTAGTSTTSFTASALSLLTTDLMAGMTLNFLSGQNQGVQSTIGTVSAAGLVSCSSALEVTPAAGDQFEICFAVQTHTVQNTTSRFSAPLLATMGFPAPFTISFTSGTNASAQSYPVVAMDAAGTVTLGTALPDVPAFDDLFTVSVAERDVFTQLYTNSTYSWAVADVLAGLNFGFPGSPTAGATSAAWYTGFPQEFPFGLAGNASAQGYYNPWAACFYNASDAYGFAFSDRVSPSPLMSTAPATQALVVTVLPENQLDAPLVSADLVTANEIDLSWPSVTGVTYSLTSTPPIDASNVTIDSATGTAKIVGLAAGTPYRFSVQGAQGNQLSLVLPYTAVTAGPLVPTSGAAPFAIYFNWAAAGTSPVPQPLALYINGTVSPKGANVTVSGQSGSNLYVLDFRDTSQNDASVYRAVLQLNLQIGPNGDHFSILGEPQVYGSSGQLSIAPPGPYQIVHTANGPISNLVLGIDFIPPTRKAFAPVNATTGEPIIAIYIGDDLYPEKNDPSKVKETLNAIHQSPLTCSIVSLVNLNAAGTTLVFNEGDKPLFDVKTGKYVGPDEFITTIKKDLRGGNVDQVYLSFSTSGTDALNNMTIDARSKVLGFIKTELGCDGIDLDYEGGNYGSGSPIYLVAQAAIGTGLRLTAAPYSNHSDWKMWVQEFKNHISWLNLQCYSGGEFNNPGEWLDVGVPIVAGADPTNGTCTPSQMQALFALWRYGSGVNYCTQWQGTPNSTVQAIAGGFIWSYDGTGKQFAAYIDAVQKGLAPAP